MEYSFDINSETEKFELYYLKCICEGRAHEGFYIVLSLIHISEPTRPY